MERFEVAVTSLGPEQVLFELRGELEIATVRKFEEALAAELDRGMSPAVLDLSKCEFIDSSGIAALVAAHGAAAQNGGGPRGPAIVVTDGQVARVLELMGLDETFAMFASRDAALAALEAGRQT